MTAVISILSWIAPPLLGALAGLAAASLLVRFFFRSFLPRNRGGWSRAIGGYLSRSIANPQTLRDLVLSEGTSARLSVEVSSLTNDLLSRPVSGIAAASSAGVTALLEPVFSTLLSRVLSSRDFIYTVRDLASRAVSSASTAKLKDLVARFDLKGLVTGKLLPQLAAKPNRESLAQSVAASLGGGAGAVLSDELLDSLPLLLEPFVPSAAQSVVRWLKSPDTRAMLSARGRELLPRILEKLNVLQRLLLSAGQFDTRLDEKMPEIVDETTATLEKMVMDPKEQRRLLWLLVDIVRDWRSAEGASGKRRESLESLIRSVVGHALMSLEDPGAAERLYRLVESRLLAGEPTVGRFARQTFGVQDTDVAELISARLLTWLSRPETIPYLAGQFRAMTARFIADSGSKPLEDLLGIDARRKEKLDAFLSSRLLDLLGRRAEAMLGALDIPALVTSRLDAMGPQEIEKPLRAAAVPWVLRIGAGIGFLVGLLQLLLRAIGLA